MIEKVVPYFHLLLSNLLFLKNTANGKPIVAIFNK